MTESELKIKFAELMFISPEDPLGVASRLFPDDMGEALKVATEWPKDLEVLEAGNKFLANIDPLTTLPTKAEHARLLWNKMQGDYINLDDFAKLSKLYADIMGHIEAKPLAVINNNQQNVSNVMILKDNGSDKEWELKLLKHQDELTNVASSN